ncbi:MAG: ABC transporter ATP-binding protein [Dysgonamonadaceae bacterium]|jgi:ABC-2 type transport system ATP-binding protein|nr:ABC transporter ATP-binding protein [Dysgonamonadaceae bacterium]
MNAIEIKSLYKTYKGADFPAVDNFSINIGQGEIFGLLGPNGAGKTTIINILCGLRSFDEGEVKVCGFSLPKQLKKIKRQIGVVPQDIALYPSLSAYENLKIFGGIFGLKKKALENRINELLSFFGLEQHKQRRIETYSGGMKRRINLIAGLLHNPEILFLDEPTVGVDVQSKTLILENLKDINRQGSTLIYTSHYMEEAEMLCTQVAFIDEGKLICQGKPQELIRQSENCGSLEALYLHLTGKKLRD